MVKLFRWLTGISLFLVTLLIFGLILLNYYFSHLTNYKTSIEGWISKNLEETVKIEQLSPKWHGFTPIIDIKNLCIQDKNNQSLLQVKHLQLSIDPLASLWTGKLQPGELFVDGMHLKLKEAPNGLVYINDIPVLTADLKNPNSEKLKRLGECFLGVGNKDLKNIQITWYGLNGKIIPIRSVFIEGKSKLWEKNYISHVVLGDNSALEIKSHVYGSILLEKFIYTNLNIRAHHLSLKTLLGDFSEKPVQFLEGFTDLNGRFTWYPNSKINFQGKINAKDVLFKTQTRLWTLNTLSMKFALARSSHHLKFDFDQLQLDLNNHNVPFYKGSVDYLFGSHPTQTIKIADLPLQKTLSILNEQDLLSTELSKNLQELHPTGDISHLAMIHRGHSFNFSRLNEFSVSAELNNFNINAWKNFPGFKNLSANVNFQPDKGNARIHSKNLRFDYSKLFRWSIPIETLNTDIEWKKQLDKWIITLSKNSYLQTKEGHVLGGLQLIIPQNKKSPMVHAKMEFEITDATHAKVYYPTSIMPQSLVGWLDNAIVSGKFSKGLFELQGRLNEFPFDHNNGKFLVASDINNVHLHYFSGLPDAQNIKGTMVFKNRSLLVNASSANVSGTNINHAAGAIKDLAHSSLNLEVSFNTNPNQKIEIAKTVLQRMHLSYSDDLFLQGGMNTHFNLWLPLNKNIKEKFKLSANTDLQDINISSRNNQINVKNLIGSFNIANNTISANKITGNWLSSPFTLSIDTLPKENVWHTLVSLHGIINTKNLQPFLQDKWFNKVEGETQYAGLIDIFQKDNILNTHIELNSNLTGLKINFPQPFAKEKDTPQETHIAAQYASNRMSVNFSSGSFLGHLIYSVLPHKFQFNQGVVAFGNELPKLPDQGLLMTGHLTKLNWATWQDIFKTKNNKKNFSSLPFGTELNIAVDKLITKNFDIDQLSLQTRKTNNNLIVNLNSSIASGRINIPDDFPNHPLQGQLDKLVWNGKKESNQSIKPNDIPPAELIINSLHYKDKDIKNIKIKVHRKANGLIIDEFKIADPLFLMQAHGDWENNHQEQQSHFQGELNVNNMGALLNHWKLTDNVVLGHGSVDFNLSWSNAINSPEMKSMQGSVNLRFRKGRIIHLSQQAQMGIGVGKVLNLLSLQTIPRRLLLDFSDLTTNGFNFDNMGGSFQLNNGSAFTNNAYLEGAEAGVHVTGKIGLAEKDYDLRLKIFPNVTSSLPIVATIAAGPIAGVATWVVDKIFSHQVKKITEIHYNVTGSWNQPNMVKLPDNKSET